MILLICSCCRNDPAGAESVLPDTLHSLILRDSIGVEVGQSCFIFGNIQGLASTPDGSIVILDKSALAVKYFTHDGNYLREFSPVGEGPGEFPSEISKMAFAESGELILSSYPDRKIVWYDSSLSMIKEIQFTSSNRSGPSRIHPAPGGGVVVESSVFIDPCSVGTEIALFHDSEEPEIIYRRRLVEYEPQGDFHTMTRMRYCTDVDGRVWISNDSFDEFRISCFSPDGDSLFCIERSFEPVRRSQDQIDERIERARRRWIESTGSSDGFNSEPIEYIRAVLSIKADDAGNIWTISAGNKNSFIVFNPDGEFLYQCEFQPPDWQECDGWNFDIGPAGVIATPFNPQMYPVVYILERVTEILAAD